MANEDRIKPVEELRKQALDCAQHLADNGDVPAHVVELRKLFKDAGGRALHTPETHGFRNGSTKQRVAWLAIQIAGDGHLVPLPRRDQSGLSNWEDMECLLQHLLEQADLEADAQLAETVVRLSLAAGVREVSEKQSPSKHHPRVARVDDVWSSWHEMPSLTFTYRIMQLLPPDAYQAYTSLQDDYGKERREAEYSTQQAILEYVGYVDHEQAIDAKVRERMEELIAEGSQYIKAGELEKRVQAAIDERIEAGALYSKSDFELLKRSHDAIARKIRILREHRENIFAFMDRVGPGVIHSELQQIIEDSRHIDC